MSATSTEVTLNHRGETYTLWMRGGKFYLRLSRNGKGIWKSLKTTQKAAALERARKHLTELERNDWKPTAKAPAQERVATLGQILVAFGKSGGQTLLSHRTIRQYAGSMKEFVSTATGKEFNPETPSSILTEDLVRKYMAACREIDPETGLPRRPDPSIQSSITQARCVLQENFSDIYRHLKLPDLTGFRVKKRFKKHIAAGFVPLDRQTVIDMETAAQSLWEIRESVWIPYAMMSVLGLRNGEVEKAKWSDFNERVVYGSDGTPKLTRTFRVRADYEEAVTGEIEVPEDFWAKLLPYKEAATSEYVCPGKNKTERAQVCERNINRFVERFIQGREKVSYELRKWAGSIVATKHGIYAAQRFLRHKSVTTTERYYATYLKGQSAASASDRAEIYGLAQAAF